LGQPKAGKRGPHPNIRAMGFLSRKKNKPEPAEPEAVDRAPADRAAAVAEEPHPIVEELEQMEQAVPEQRSEERHGAGVEEAGYDEETEGEHAVNAEQAEDRAEHDAEPAEPAEPEQPEEEDGRMKAVDLIAPTRLDFIRREEQEVAEEETAHAEVIAFANQKGGVAKTTTTLNLAVAFAESGHRVLCIDLDPQGNLTMSQGIDPDKVERSLYDVLVNDMPISEVIHKREIDIAVASIDLAGAEIAMSTKIGRERTLEKALKEVIGDYDFVCIDTPPSLGLLTINALTAANKVIVPVQCEYLSMRGLVQLQNTLRMIQENLNPDVRIEGILPTMLDTRTIHAKEAVEILEENFGDLVFRSRIRKAIKFAEAPVKGSSVLKYDSGSSAANYYRELAKEVLANGSA
jgi:chromosome partitioning protein